MSILKSSILSRVQALQEGGITSPKEFLHLGSRAAVDQTFTRLVHSGQLMRIGRGIYSLPVSGRFGVRPPAIEKVLKSLARITGERIVPSEAAAANSLGVTTQVPVREIFLTSGRSRKLRLGSREIEIKKVPAWKLVLGPTPPGAAIRALSWIGPDQAVSSLASIRQRLSEHEWQTVVDSRQEIPDWMARTIGNVAISV